MSKGRPFLLAACALALSTGLAACGDDDDKGKTGAQTTDPPPTAPASGTSTPAPKPAAGGANKDLKVKPVIAKPSGSAPGELQKDDIVVGTGKEAKDGDMVTVKYVGVAFSTGQEFDASWERGTDFPFQLGAGAVIEGWDKGVPGMKVGGRRQLTIPPGQAYGESGSPPAIGPNETLVFVIDLVSVN